MVNRFSWIVVGGVVLSAAAPARPARAQTNEAASTPAQKQSRYQIGQMERLLEGAVEHGLNMVRDRLQTAAQVPPDLLVSDNAHARGFRLEGYGVFFDVSVPSFDATLNWTLRTLDQNDLGLQSALRTLQTHVRTSGDPSLEQALRRLELQMPSVVTRTASSAPDPSGARNATGSAASTPGEPAARSDDPLLSDPSEAYRTEVTQALKDA